MCCAEFIVKYVMFFVNLLFSLAGLGLVVVGIVVIVQVSDILELIPVNINAIPISIIIAGSVIFVIAFCGCWGAIRESGCLLVIYAVIMIILAAAKIYLAVVIFRNLNGLQNTVDGWLTNAFNNENLRGPFQVLELTFRCCGTTGADAYLAQSLPIPPTCCSTSDVSDITDIVSTCTLDNSFGGCNVRLSNYFESFGDAIGAVIIVIICVELVAMIFALFLNHSISNKRRARY